MESLISASLAMYPGEILLKVAAYLSVSDLNALVQTALRLQQLLSQELYSRAPTLMRRDYKTPLIWAAEQGRIASVRKLLAHDPNPRRFIDDRAAIHHAAAEGQIQTIAMLLEAADRLAVSLPDDEGRTPLNWAVIQDQSASVRFLLMAGAGYVTHPTDINWEWGCALQEAVMRGHEVVTRILLESGAIFLVTIPPSQWSTRRSTRSYSWLLCKADAV